MRNDPIHPDSEPSPELLAAFLDGELDAPARIRIEAWLAKHSSAVEEIEGQRGVVRLWRANPPREPSQVAWAAVFARIEVNLRPAFPRRPGVLPRTLWLSAGLAAAILAAVLLTRFFQPGGGSIAGNDPLPVIASGDVTVISMEARDAVGLVVAAPPIQEPILLTSQDDVSIVNVQSYWQDDGQVPTIGEGEVSMIVAPSVARAGNSEP